MKRFEGLSPPHHPRGIEIRFNQNLLFSTRLGYEKPSGRSGAEVAPWLLTHKMELLRNLSRALLKDSGLKWCNIITCTSYFWYACVNSVSHGEIFSGNIITCTSYFWYGCVNSVSHGEISS
ncbi:hypothetical protein CEXT_378601 [Caerostris extrusa]|uniref:Uncharacterized protein n=1 Tax=Caerostris extrusa TaxID=172846 RepID=A0AAV4MZC3_CAEEX|nr:hypothetical protein CEXT_378601 [Caerostris extrusa]